LKCSSLCWASDARRGVQALDAFLEARGVPYLKRLVAGTV